MKIQFPSRSRRQAGYSALFITLVLVAASMVVLGATLGRSVTIAKLNDRNSSFVSADGAAEAAVEKVLARMMIDFSTYGEGQVLSNLSMYSTNLPNSSENPYWTNFTWSDAIGHNGQIYVARTTTSSNAPYIALEQQYTGLSGYASTYRILANVTMANSTFSYNFTNAVQQDVQLAQIPVFQFAIFYNGLLEFSDTATFIITGPVHANSNIYVGSPSDLTFNSIVTTTGNITAPGNLGMGSNQWTGHTYYNGSPTPGYLTGQPSLNLPIGTNSTVGSSVQQILYPPPSGEAANSAMGSQRYYNKAGLVIYISNTTYAVTIKSSSSDPNPVTITNLLTTLTNANASSNYFPFISTTNQFYDWREAKTMKLTQLDIGKLTNWMQTNVYVYNSASTSNKFNSSSSPLNIVYVVDYRDTNSSVSTAVRLYNGANLPSAGLTVATPCPMYIWGVYNCPVAAYKGTTNTLNSVPASVAADAVTILSPGWSDAQATSSSGTRLSINAQDDTVNTAMIAGIVPSTGTSSTTYSGGANNFPRLLENWSGDNLWLNTSIVCLFASTWANTPYRLSGYYFNPPTRHFAFDQNYMSSSKMPPGTPNICRLIRANWCNPQPGTTNYPSVTLDFVPH